MLAFAAPMDSVVVPGGHKPQLNGPSPKNPTMHVEHSETSRAPAETVVLPAGQVTQLETLVEL